MKVVESDLTHWNGDLVKLSDLAIKGNKKNQNKWLASMFQYSPIYSCNREINFISLLPELPLTFTRFQVSLLVDSY